MFETVTTIVGNVLNTPELRRLPASRAAVAKFKVAATSRRYDKDHGRWVDGASLRMRVNCWRRLAENVAASVATGDPVVVTGRIYTRDWVGDDGQHRVSYEMDAVAVGHDLARGRGRFERNRAQSTTTDEDLVGAGSEGQGDGTVVMSGDAAEDREGVRADFGGDAPVSPRDFPERLVRGQREPAPISA
jgi:single-strand DNA-binding protein